MAKKEVAKVEVPVSINAELVSDYETLINAQGEREFISKWADAQFKGEITQRDLVASLKQAESVGFAPSIRSAYGNYFLSARQCLTLKGAESVPVAHFLKVVSVAQRNFNAGFKKEISKVDFAGFMKTNPTWEKLETEARKIEDRVKATKENGGKRKSKGAEIEGEITADSICALALGLFNDLDDLTITDFETAEKLANTLATALKTSRAGQKQSKEKHPSHA